MPISSQNALLPVLPVGTQIVTLVEAYGSNRAFVRPRGTVGVILHAPDDPSQPYTVRFLDGGEALLKREEIEPRKQFQRDGLGPDEAAQDDLFQYVIYRCVVGSRAYGLDDSASDTDRRGIYLPPARLHWSLYGVPDQIERPETEEAYWEIQKFLILALKANPNVLECLYTPLVEEADPLALELREMRDVFLSRLVYQTYNGYVLSQFKKLEGVLRNRGAIKWKHAMHLIRLLLSGVRTLNEGIIPVRVDDAHRDRLLDIKRGDLAWEEVNRWRLELHAAFDDAFAHTSLPERPDVRLANDFLLRARRTRVED